MNRLVNIISRYMTVLVALGFLLPFWSCSQSEEPTPEDTEGEGKFRLKFSIVTKTVSSTRAADITGDQIGSVPENFLDVSDIRFLIFDGYQNFVSDITPKAEIQAANDSFTIYNVVARVDEPYFTENISNNNLEFYIVVFANYSYWNITLPPLQTGLTLNSLFTNGLVMNEIPNTENLFKADTDDADRQLFPMAGLQRFNINANNLLNTSEDSPFDLSNVSAGGKEINMLRALAKIEVIDKVNIEENSVYTDNPDYAVDPLRIASVDLNGYLNKGTMLPSATQWSREGTFETQQVIAPTIPDNASYRRPPVLYEDDTLGPPLVADYQLQFEYDQRATQEREDKCPVYSCYVYEFNSNRLNYGTMQRPYCLVTTAGGTLDGVTYQPITMPMRITQYLGETATEPSILLRNHIYRFEIVGLHQDIQVNWTVCPMTNIPVNIDFN
ncbi:MAG: hypothetical protein K2H71_12540 [Muribaculaceae bacterium]|nr:hypothetical protein [Muribaculaceae bacterium]